MPHVGSEIDASFYQLIHKMLETPRGTAGPERRCERRRAFRVAQRIARWEGAGFPDEREFSPVQCHDLTRSGFSFLADAEPDFSMLVAEFGSPPNAIYVAAEVLHSVPVMCYPSGAMTRLSGGQPAVQEVATRDERGKIEFLVGCRLTRRLRRPS